MQVCWCYFRFLFGFLPKIRSHAALLPSPFARDLPPGSNPCIYTGNLWRWRFNHSAYKRNRKEVNEPIQKFVLYLSVFLGLQWWTAHQLSFFNWLFGHMNTANSAFAHGQNSVALNNNLRNWKMNRCYDIYLLLYPSVTAGPVKEELEVGGSHGYGWSYIYGGGLISHAI